MTDLQHSHRSSPPAHTPAVESALREHGRQIRDDAVAFVTTLQDSAEDLERYLRQQMKQQPYRTLALAAGVGYVLGGGLRARLTRLVVGVGARLAMAVVAREFAESVERSRSSPRP